jgi:thiamine biosynthesis lipoprotein
MVLGVDEGSKLLLQYGLDALFLMRDDEGSIRGVEVGNLFSDGPVAISCKQRDRVRFAFDDV